MYRANQITVKKNYSEQVHKLRWGPPQLLFQIASKQSPLNLENDLCTKKLKNKPAKLYLLFTWMTHYRPAYRRRKFPSMESAYNQFSSPFSGLIPIDSNLFLALTFYKLQSSLVMGHGDCQDLRWAVTDSKPQRITCCRRNQV